eukprot:1258896-Rhodomonas_salina.1
MACGFYQVWALPPSKAQAPSIPPRLPPAGFVPPSEAAPSDSPLPSFRLPPARRGPSSRLPSHSF